MNIKNLLHLSSRRLADFTDTPHLETELLLAAVLAVDRAYLHGYPEQVVSEAQQNSFQELLHRRLKREPIAYILEKQAFWNIELKVTQDVLIPRPETELLVATILENFSSAEALDIAELGTGSGAITLAIAKEQPNWSFVATDISIAALTVAKTNAEQLALTNVQFFQGDWCAGLPAKKFTAIVSNPPYIATNDVHLRQLAPRYEPSQALIAGMDGLDAIRIIVQQASEYLITDGMLLLEHGYNQARAVQSLLAKNRFREIKTYCDLAGHQRVTGALLAA